VYRIQAIVFLVLEWARYLIVWMPEKCSIQYDYSIKREKTQVDGYMIITLRKIYKERYYFQSND